VPMKLASTAPMARMAVFSPGELQIATHIDAASHRVQGGQQDHERQILASKACTRFTPAAPKP
jgi:hypothetical protein